MRPVVVRALLPLIPFVLRAVFWPELRYWFGEWGYMPRPLAYMVSNVEVWGVGVVVSGDTVALGNDSSMMLSIDVGPIEVSSGGKLFYMDNAWQPWWGLEVSIGETIIH